MVSFKKKSYESAMELEKNLDKSSFLISEEISESNNFIEYSNDFANIGFIYYNVGLEPQIELLAQSNKIFLGVNKIYACLDYDSKSLLFKEELPSLLYEILVDSDAQYIIYICELDIFVYKNDGSFLWKMGFRDIIKDYYLDGDKSIVIEYNDGDKISFSLESGKIK